MLLQSSRDGRVTSKRKFGSEMTSEAADTKRDDLIANTTDYVLESSLVHCGSTMGNGRDVTQSVLASELQ